MESLGTWVARAGEWLTREAPESTAEMNDAAAGRTDRTVTRRRVLQATAGAVGTAAVAGEAAAQSGGTETETGTESGGQISATTLGIIPEQQNVQGSVEGFWIHVGGTVNPVEAGVADNCDLVDWGNDSTLAYDAQLIDRTAEPAQTGVTLYLPESVEVAPGTLFIVNDRERCESGYVGVELEQLGMDLNTLVARDASGGGIGETSTATDTEMVDETTTGGSGPGLGIASALAGVAGGGWLLNRHRED